ncbi:MAG TPA: type II toxin-antitoxin system HigB family toxin, partial [Phycisphaerales bacterium]|nr:type II toxin-antitoxin system HigB family toxin [Phycisphaerales bacterium]
RLKEFWAKHPDAEQPLKYWYKKTQKTEWFSFADIRKTFNSADSYKEMVIFNIAGNKYRLVAKVEYRLKIVFVGKIMTHAEYSKDKWKGELL